VSGMLTGTFVEGEVEGTGSGLRRINEWRSDQSGGLTVVDWKE
jgi:hypothetical protein